MHFLHKTLCFWDIDHSGVSTLLCDKHRNIVFRRVHRTQTGKGVVRCSSLRIFPKRELRN